MLLLAATLSAPAEVSAQRVVPNANWVSAYFGSVDRLTRHLHLPRLRTAKLHPGDLDVRIWEGFGISGYRGYVIRRIGQRWSGLAVTEDTSGRPAFPKVPAAADWGATWEELERGGLADIRDDSELVHCQMVMDGIGYVIETAKEDYYRTYLVDNPQSQRSQDGDRFLQLLPILRRAFGESTEGDFAALSSGEVRSVSSVAATSSSTSGNRPLTAWKWAGAVVPWDTPARSIRSEDALASGLDLKGPRCEDLPVPVRYLTGEVAVEVLIDAGGSVFAARALSGPPMLLHPSVDWSFRWQFPPGERRNAVLSIKYDRQWIPFPWNRRHSLPGSTATAREPP
jgi:hypothetical protein